MFHLKDTDLFLKVRKPIAVNAREEQLRISEENKKVQALQ